MHAKAFCDNRSLTWEAVANGSENAGAACFCYTLWLLFGNSWPLRRIEKGVGTVISLELL
jgi:hypothetical protein